MIGDVEVDEPGHGRDIRSKSRSGKLGPRQTGGSGDAAHTDGSGDGMTLAMAGDSGMAEDTHKGYEMPPYTVERTDGGARDPQPTARIFWPR